MTAVYFSCSRYSCVHVDFSDPDNSATSSDRQCVCVERPPLPDDKTGSGPVSGTVLG